jgi:hypothetical protein
MDVSTMTEAEAIVTSALCWFGVSARNGSAAMVAATAWACVFACFGVVVQGVCRPMRVSTVDWGQMPDMVTMLCVPDAEGLTRAHCLFFLTGGIVVSCFVREMLRAAIWSARSRAGLAAQAAADAAYAAESEDTDGWSDESE